MKLSNNLKYHLIGIMIVLGYEQGTTLAYFGKLLPHELLYYLVDIPFFYACAILLFPFNKAGKYSFLTKLLFSFLFFIAYSICEIFIYGIIKCLQEGRFIFPQNDLFYKRMFLRSIHIIGYSFAYHIARVGIKKAKNARQKEIHLLEKERGQIELENAFLRSQINPHLLANSLHFIRYQIEVGSPKAMRAVDLLGEVMNYSLQASSENKVSLNDELSYIKRYVELVRLRDDDNRYFELRITMEDAAEELYLPPGIMINLVENVFKHGDLKKEHDAALMLVEVKAGQLSVQVRNLILPRATYPSTGIGMANIRKRLDLLYPDRYLLTAEEKDQHYHLYFKIAL